MLTSGASDHPVISGRGTNVPTRRQMELMVIVSLAIRPAWGMVKLWTHKTLGSKPPGSFLHGVAEVTAVLA